MRRTRTNDKQTRRQQPQRMRAPPVAPDRRPFRSLTHAPAPRAHTPAHRRPVACSAAVTTRAVASKRTADRRRDGIAHAQQPNRPDQISALKHTAANDKRQTGRPINNDRERSGIRQTVQTKERRRRRANTIIDHQPLHCTALHCTAQCSAMRHETYREHIANERAGQSHRQRARPRRSSSNERSRGEGEGGPSNRRDEHRSIDPAPSASAPFSPFSRKAGEFYSELSRNRASKKCRI
jgi:hypothetical protein